MRFVVPCVSTSFPWLVFLATLLWGSTIHKHTGSWMWRGNASVVSLNWEKCSCRSKLVSALSMLLSSVLSWSVSQAWNPRQTQLSPDTRSLRLSQASVRLLWSPSWCRWCGLSSVIWWQWVARIKLRLEIRSMLRTGDRKSVVRTGRSVVRTGRSVVRTGKSVVRTGKSELVIQ